MVEGQLTLRRDRLLAMKAAAARGDVVAVSRLLTDELVESQALTKHLNEGLSAARELLREARALLEPLEWLDDDGRECAWCRATRHTFNRPEDMGTPRECKARDNHRKGCRWRVFVESAAVL